MKKFISIIVSAILVLNLLCVLVGTSVSAESYIYGDYRYEIQPDNTICITNYNGSATELVIPNTINGKTVTAIGDNVFPYINYITKITVPSNVKTIGKHAFLSLHDLTTINLPSGLTEIKTGAFCNCTSLTSINIPNSVEKIGKEAFMWCKKLNSIKIPNKVVVLEQSTFEGCKSLVSVFLPESLTKIYFRCFNECDFLTNASYNGYKSDLLIDLENEPLTKVIKYTKDKGTFNSGEWYFDFTNGVLKITGNGNMKFGYNQTAPWTTYKNEIKSVIIESGITSIADYAFVDCVNLNSVSIPNTVSSIGENAFERCPFITNLNIPSNISYIDGKFIVMPKETNPKEPTNPSTGSTQLINPTESTSADNWVVVKAPTCEENGVEVNYSTQNSRTVPALGHKIKVISKKAATYFAKGYTGYEVCSTCCDVISKGKTIAKLKLGTPKVKITAGTQKLTVKYTKVKNATGFQVRYLCKGKTKTKTFITKKSATKVINKLKKGTYKVKVRALIKSKGKTAYSNWTKIKQIKIA